MAGIDGQGGSAPEDLALEHAAQMLAVLAGQVAPAPSDDDALLSRAGAARPARQRLGVLDLWLDHLPDPAPVAQDGQSAVGGPRTQKVNAGLTFCCKPP